MKNLITLLALFAIFSSCSKDDDVGRKQEFDSSKYPQKWELVRITGQLVGSEQTGEDMQWQEFYLLKSDGTFLRNRENEGVIFKESGTFSIHETQNEELLITLTYNRANDLVGSCYGSETEEVLYVTSSSTIQNTWNACDGPGLEYKRVE